MGVIFEVKGVVKKVNEIQRFSSGFEKRELVLTDDVGTQVAYPNIMCFAFKQERVKLLEGITMGQRVKVVFAIDGREWTDNTGKTRYFTDLTGLKLERLDIPDEGQNPPSERNAEQSQDSQENGTDDLPF